MKNLRPSGRRLFASADEMRHLRSRRRRRLPSTISKTHSAELDMGLKYERLDTTIVREDTFDTPPLPSKDSYSNESEDDTGVVLPVLTREALRQHDGDYSDSGSSTSTSNSSGRSSVTTEEAYEFNRCGDGVSRRSFRDTLRGFTASKTWNVKESIRQTVNCKDQFLANVDSAIEKKVKKIPAAAEAAETPQRSKTKKAAQHRKAADEVDEPTRRSFYFVDSLFGLLEDDTILIASSDELTKFEEKLYKQACEKFREDYPGTKLKEYDPEWENRNDTLRRTMTEYDPAWEEDENCEDES